LAKVTGESAQQVSEWMTAIWNNFYDGSKSLEHYADVVAKLGAETATSVDEIAAALGKFSSIADTVGLSFEYASALVATIASRTRESAETIGTNLKTVLARIEGLSLGETLDDGTTLNKYSSALATVGVNIKTTSGELKDMDTILEEIAATWTHLARD
jgi:TP901 family phage tail tape measure protein